MIDTLDPAPGARIAIVGGCGGIGRALVEACVALDARVTVLDLPASLAEHPPPEDTVSAPVDVTDGESVMRAFAGLGPIEALVNLAGFTVGRTPVAATDPAQWEAILCANLTGAFLVASAALPLLRRAASLRSPTALVNVSSGLAARLMPGYGAYGASKAGMIALTKALAVENAPLVRANVVAPGAVETAFQRGGTGREAADLQFDAAAYVRTVPLGRIAEPDDVVGPILFLCGPGAAFMTGQVLWVNGGALTP